MNAEEALSFLQAHQPMPPDEELTEELITKYDEIRRFLISNPTERAIPLLLGSFGEGDGFGVYQLVEDVLMRFPAAAIVGHLRTGLISPIRSVRYWNAEIAANFPADVLVPELTALLQERDEDINAAAVIALGQIGHPAAVEALKLMLEMRPGDHIESLIREQLS